MKIKCFDNSIAVIIPDVDTPIVELEVTEPLTPTSSFFTLNAGTPSEKRYMVKKCLRYSTNPEKWMATIQEVKEIGIGANDPNFSIDSKIFGSKAMKFQMSRNKLKSQGINTDILEELSVDHTKLQNSQIAEIAGFSKTGNPTKNDYSQKLKMMKIL